MDYIFEDIFGYVSGLEIIDTHEHLPYNEDARNKDTDVLKEYLTHYISRDLISAGLKTKDFMKAVDNRLPLSDRWELVAPFWEASRYTGYGRSLDISVKELYGIERICQSTIHELNEAFLNSMKPGHFQKVLKNRSNIKISLLDSNLDCDKSFFRSVYRLDHFIKPDTYEAINNVESDLGIRICSMDDWLEACETTLDKVLKSGAVALKCGLAYERSLMYKRVNRKDAEEEFLNVFKVKHYPDWTIKSLNVGMNFQNYMMHFILKLANKRNLTFQFHTGLQEGSGNIISNSDPSLLSNLFLEYPDVDFDIFHIGYPYQHVLSALAKMFPNVYIDMCWAHIISPTASINALIEWIDSVPINKISAFGGDYCFIDGVYGHQYIARENVSKSLAVKVREGIFDIEHAKKISKAIFFDNPYKIFKLDGKI